MNLDTEKSYYLSHPLTTSGDIGENYEKEQKCRNKIIAELPESKRCGIIRPLICLPDVRTCDIDQKTAMEKCIALLQVCEGIILCPGWESSKGCQQEFNYAKDTGKEIIYFDELWN